jgi:hypothetical protein
MNGDQRAKDHDYCKASTQGISELVEIECII